MFASATPRPIAIKPSPFPSLSLSSADKLEKLKIVRAVLEQGGHFSGVNRKCQIKPTAWEDAAPGEDPRCREALLIVKHGGVLTHAGRVQTERLGQNYRMTMYPRYGPSGGGLLRLHSTYRHDLKIYSSGEGTGWGSWGVAAGVEHVGRARGAGA